MKYVSLIHNLDLYPTDPAEAAKVDMWLQWVSQTLTPLLLALLKINHFPRLGMGEKPSSTEAEYMKNNFLDAISIFSGYLKGKDYLCGDKPSIVDIHMYVLLHHIMKYSGEWDKSNLNMTLRGYFGRLGQLKGIQREQKMLSNL